MAAVALAVGSIGAPHAAQPAELGRLFLTPQQRIELDKRRQANAVEAETVVESTVTLNGQVTRSSGKTTVWLNGVPQYDSAGTL
jgi:molybdopterin-biosynthesis enzyme MoeA-like protein